MKILVTGADGQLGLALQSELRQHQLTALDIGGLDITDPDSVRRTLGELRPEIVINAAAYTDVDGAESDPVGAYRVNAGGPGNLALVTAELAIPLLHVSTDYVFDGRARRPYHEHDATGPQSVYGASKLAGEDAVRASNARHYVVRTAWLYHTAGENFPRTILSLASKEEVRVVEDQRGSPTYAPHLARAISRLMETGAYGTYHLAGRGGASWFELARSLYRHLGIETPLRPVTTAEFPRSAERPRYSVLTTVQNPRILLPAWEDAIEEFARAVKAGALREKS